MNVVDVVPDVVVGDDGPMAGPSGIQTAVEPMAVESVGAPSAEELEVEPYSVADAEVQTVPGPQLVDVGTQCVLGGRVFSGKLVFNLFIYF